MINGFLRVPIPFKHDISIYVPSVKDSVENPSFNQWLSLLTISQFDIENTMFDLKNLHPEEPYDLSTVPTPLQYLCQSARAIPMFNNTLIAALEFFLQQEVFIVYDNNEIWVGNIDKILEESTEVQDFEQVPKITEADFSQFQNLIRQAVGQQPIQPYDMWNTNSRTKRMLALSAERDKVAALQKARKNESIDMETMLVALCCTGNGLTPLNIGEMSFCAASQLLQMYQQKEQYETNIASLLAGGNAKKIKLEYWIRKLNKEN